MKRSRPQNEIKGRIASEQISVDVEDEIITDKVNLKIQKLSSDSNETSQDLKTT